MINFTSTACCVCTKCGVKTRFCLITAEVFRIKFEAYYLQIDLLHLYCWHRESLAMKHETCDDLSPNIALPPAKQVDTSAASRDTWVSMFAMLTISGVDISMCAERLGKPVTVLSNLFATTPFQDLLKSIARETGKDAAVSLLKASAVDSVTAIIKLRDSSSSDSVKLRAATTLLTWNYFHQKSDKLPQGDNAVHDALRKSGLDVNTAVDQELARLIESNPVLKSHPLLSSLNAPDVREGVSLEGGGSREVRPAGYKGSPRDEG